MVNTSSAVMAQRNHPKDSRDDFPTPPWATRALFEHCMPELKDTYIWEPTANRGHMVRAIAEYTDVEGSDIHDYGHGFKVHDFLAGGCPFDGDGFSEPPSVIVMNPPFNKAEEFIDMAYPFPVVAVFVRLQFLESKGRYKRLFNVNPPSQIWAFTERVGLVHGKLDRTVSSPTAYCWMIWQGSHAGPTGFNWIPPCRKQLEKDTDYE